METAQPARHCDSIGEGGKGAKSRPIVSILIKIGVGLLREVVHIWFTWGAPDSSKLYARQQAK